MIKTELQVPSNYSSRSRDFQLLSCIYDSLFNSSKTYSDMIGNIPIENHIDRRLLDLLTHTLCFESRRHYDENDLYTLCSAFKSIMRKKGSESAIRDCIRVLLKAQNINKDFDVVITNEVSEFSEDTPYLVSIYIPAELNDLALLEDLLDYVMPAGYVYNLIISVGRDELSDKTPEAVLVDEIESREEYKNSELGHVYIKNGDTYANYSTENSMLYGNVNKDEE